jgi:putative transposase
MKLTLDERRIFHDTFKARQATGQPLAPWVTQQASKLAVSERYVWMLGAGVPERTRRGWQLPDEAIDLYYDTHGDVPKIYERLHSAGRFPYHIKTLKRAFLREMDADERAFAALGAVARRKHTGTILWEAAHRNAVWQTDHTHLKVPVNVPGLRHPRQLRLTYFLDCRWRLIMGWVISVQPSADSVLEALREAILIDLPDKPFGGKPLLILYDNGLEFLALAVQAAAGLLDIETRAVSSYSPHKNGRVERCHQTISRIALSEMPLWKNGPRDISGRLYDAGRPVVDWEVMVREIDLAIRHYNFERAHSSIGGLTPLEGFLSDDTQLRTETPERLRFALKTRKVQKVDQRGVYKHGGWYRADELDYMVGDSVTVAWLSKDQRSVDVYRLDGTFLCTARPHRTLTHDQVIDNKKGHAQRARELDKRAKASRERARIRYAPASTPGAAQIISVQVTEATPDELEYLEDLERLADDDFNINESTASDSVPAAGIPSLADIRS